MKTNNDNSINENEKQLSKDSKINSTPTSTHPSTPTIKQQPSSKQTSNNNLQTNNNKNSHPQQIFNTPSSITKNQLPHPRTTPTSTQK